MEILLFGVPIGLVVALGAGRICEPPLESERRPEVAKRRAYFLTTGILLMLAGLAALQSMMRIAELQTLPAAGTCGLGWFFVLAPPLVMAGATLGAAIVWMVSLVRHFSPSEPPAEEF